MLRSYANFKIVWHSRLGQIRNFGLNKPRKAISQSNQAAKHKSTVLREEVCHFDKLATDWWSSEALTRSLQQMNNSRIQFINNVLFNGVAKNGRWLSGAEILDVGCGGGFLTENLARLGAKVCGIDASKVSIKAAELHSRLDPDIMPNLAYKIAAPEDICEEFDIVTAMEVLEHVDNPDFFLKSLFARARPGGFVFMSTISRTVLAYFLTIVLAEKLMRMVPSGTHSFSKFIKPQELKEWIETSNLGEIKSIQGVIYNPIERDWFLAPSNLKQSTHCNYLIAVKKT